MRLTKREAYKIYDEFLYIYDIEAKTGDQYAFGFLIFVQLSKIIFTEE